MLQESSISFMSTLILIGSAQGLFLAVALVFMRKGNRRSNLFLSALVLTLSILLFDRFLNVTNYFNRYSNLIGLAWPLIFLIGPFVYFYIRELSLPKRIVFSWRQLLHFLPIAMSALYIVYSMSANEKALRFSCMIEPKEGTWMISQNIVPLLVAIQKVVYFALAFLLVTDYSSRIKQSFSSLDKISLSWIRTLLLLFFSLLVLFTFFSYFADLLGIRRDAGNFIAIATAAVIYVMAFKAILQPEIFLQIEIAHQAELIRTSQSAVPDAPSPAIDILLNGNGMLSKEKYRKAFLSKERAAEIARKLVHVMETEKPFLNPELTLQELADRLSVSPHNVSQVINQEMNKSFFDFVNESRVQEAKKLLRSSKHGHFSILAIALDAGFNSKSSFYTAFGKNTGMIPSQFRKTTSMV